LDQKAFVIDFDGLLMCSIIGYYGNDLAAPIVVNGLRRMEYRGYDSVGVATESDNQIELKKGIGKVNEVNSKLQLDTSPGKTGIGHTRWATHGKDTDPDYPRNLAKSVTVK
jgi:glucosamine--fructose-6-phosphate aminotransferase (isomerizing)